LMKKSMMLAVAAVILLSLAVGQLLSTSGKPMDDNQVKPAVADAEKVEKQEKPAADDEGLKEDDPKDETTSSNGETEITETGTSETSDTRTGEIKAEKALPARVAVKGIYATGFTAGSKNIERLIDLIDKTELNALVVDIKDATGYLTTPLETDPELSVSAVTYKIKDLPALVTDLKERGIYTIARVVVFKDPLVADRYPELAVQRKSGGIWRDYKGKAWTNPYKKEVWDYNVDIALAAIRAGFEEIQFDYVRFPSDGPLKEAVYPGKDNKNRADTIEAFLAYAGEKIHKAGAFVSADVFGLTCSAEDDLGIGQKIELIAGSADYVSPMVYPSHYAPGSYGIKNPNASPYKTVYKSLTDAVYKTRDTDNIIRPWLQDFSYGYSYGAKEVRAQIKATYDAGLEEWILWNASNRYTGRALNKE